jgi:hypothetical protein
LRRFLRTACAEEIYDASDHPRAVTEGVLSSRLKREVWSFEAPDFGDVMVRNPNKAALKDDRVAFAKIVWTRQAAEGDVSAEIDLRKVASLESDLRRDGKFHLRPILQDVTERISLHDGRHRLVAAHACWSDGTFVAPIQVFWVMPADAHPA